MADAKPHSAVLRGFEPNKTRPMKRKRNKSSKPRFQTHFRAKDGPNRENKIGRTFHVDDIPKFRATIEVMSTESFREQVTSAELIMTYPASPEWNPQIAYGKQKLEHIVSSGSASMLRTLCLVIDWTSMEPEYLIALLRNIKGECDIE
jgi:hypothetical protein